MLNKAASQLQTHRHAEAEAIYRHVRHIDPDNAEPDWNLSLLYMLTGNFEAGWAMREARWKKANPGVYPKFSVPRWFGEGDIEGKTIVICADEGLGDTIQFVRYVPMVASLGARVILVVDPPAHALLSGTPGIAQCLRKDLGVSLPFDLHCPMSGLPLAFGTRSTRSRRAKPTCLPCPQAACAPGKTASAPTTNCGSAWSGPAIPRTATITTDRPRCERSARIFDLDATFVSLQKDPRPERSRNAASSIRRFSIRPPTLPTSSKPPR